ncbi:uncharacterized protein [Nicotiana tomentosiformis]|uniref:uncharacterized protein n=1 Tax=Nicotiana tomentosiformis TaxID=4098 RepID=UPI00388C6268
MGRIENMFKQMMEKNANSDAQLVSHNTSIHNLEVQLRQISQALNTHPKGALPSNMVVNLKGGNNTGYAMDVTTRSGKGGDSPTSSQRKIMDDEQVVQEDEVPNNVDQANDEARIDIDNNVEETQEEILSINEPLVEALEKMPGYAKFMKDLVTKKWSMNYEIIKMTHQVSAIVHSMAPKLEDPGAFTIPCTIGSSNFAKALCDLGASINLMPYSIFKTLGIGQPRPASMRLKMADRTMKRPFGVINDVLVRVDKFILPADFVFLECEVDYEVPIILGRPFLATGKSLVDVEAGELTFQVGDEKAMFHVRKSMRQLNSNEVCSFVDLVTDVIIYDTSATINVGDMMEAVLINFDDEEMDDFMECVDSKLAVFNKRKKSIGWTLADIRGINPEFCMLAGREFYCFLDGYSCYNQILIAPEDQEETTFTFPYGTFAFKRIPFGLCNAPITFQWCMMAIFTDMVEDYHEVFMDDFSVVGDSFDDCLENLDKVLARCEETNLVMNWDKCHFMFEEGIVLGHKISKKGIEIDKEKIEVISKLPPPTSVKGVRSFLCHTGFYRCFIKDFSKVVNPLCKLLEKDAKFHFNDDCMKAFELLKFKLTTTPIITAPN